MVYLLYFLFVFFPANLRCISFPFAYNQLKVSTPFVPLLLLVCVFSVLQSSHVKPTRPNRNRTEKDELKEPPPRHDRNIGGLAKHGTLIRAVRLCRLSDKRWF